jgi:DNA-binding NarL/FixJ family response regulator
MLILADLTLTPDQRNWLVLLLALFAVGYLLFRPKLKKKKDPLEQPVFSSLAQQRTVERQMQNLLVELSEMARQISAQLDTRAAKLEALIQEADQKLAALRNATGSSPSEPQAASIFTLPTADSRFVAPAPPHSPPPRPVDPRYAEIYSLADSGRPVQEIANQLGKSDGEVELILALRQRA